MANSNKMSFNFQSPHDLALIDKIWSCFIKGNWTDDKINFTNNNKTAGYKEWTFYVNTTRPDNMTNVTDVGDSYVNF